MTEKEGGVNAHREFTKEQYVRFKKVFMLAQMTGVKTFKFDGTEFTTDFAKYIVEWLDKKFAITAH